MKNMGRLAAFVGLGMELVAFVGVLLYAGQHLDKKYGWPGYGMTFGGLAGLVLWLIHVIVIVNKYEKEEKQSSSDG